MIPVRYHLPGLRYNYPLNMFWVSLLKTHPEFFRENVEIGSFFGVFPYSLWNGGRLLKYDQCDSDFVKRVIKSANDEGIPIRYTFNNTMIEEEDLKDPFSNFCMEAANNGMNEVMIMSPLLEDYLRNKYPNFKYNSSTCKEIKDVETLNAELDKDYQYVVLDFNMNNKFELYEKMPKRDRLEVLVNTLCEPGCKRRKEHYKNVAINQKNIVKNKGLPPDKQIPIIPWYCEFGDHNCIHTIQDYPTFVSVDDIYDKYIPLGINNFKIEGRTAYLFSLIDTYCYYMIKPECIGEARLLLIKNLEKAHVFNITQPRPSVWP